MHLVDVLIARLSKSSNLDQVHCECDVKAIELLLKFSLYEELLLGPAADGRESRLLLEVRCYPEPVGDKHLLGQTHA